MFRIALLVSGLAAIGCAGDETCGTLTLELGESAASYPTTAAIGCDVPKAGVWDKTHNVAALVLTASNLPDDVYVAANLPLAMVKSNVTLVVPTGISGEAYTGGSAAQHNHANLTDGTVTIEGDFGTDPSGPSRVFKVKWDLTWLGTGTYQSTGESRVWFTAPPGGKL